MGRSLTLSGFGFNLPAAPGAFSLTGDAVGLASGTSGGSSQYISINSSGLMVDQSGAAFFPRGGNCFGLEGQGLVQGWYNNANMWGGLAGPGGPSWPVYCGQWKFNFVRIPLNPALFFNLPIGVLTGSNASSIGWSGTTVAADPNGYEKAAIIRAIVDGRANGIKLFSFDLHWSAPKFTFGGVTQFLGPCDQPAFIDYDMGYPFWTAGVGAGPLDANGNATTGFVAWLQQTFGPSGAYFDSNHGGSSGINDIAFELFNEPYLDGLNCNFNTASQGAGSSQTRYQVMKSGGWCSSCRLQYSGNVLKGGIGLPNSYCGSVAAGQSNITTVDTYGLNAWWRVAGYQQVVNGIRALGATNIILINGESYANNQSTLSQVFPTDTLSTPQLASGFHAYQNSGVYPNPGGSSWDSAVNATLAGTGGIGYKIPVLITEYGNNYTGASGYNAPQPDTYMQYIQGWMDGKTKGSVGCSDWAWDYTASYPLGTNTYIWYDTIYGAPISINGSVSAGVLTVTSGSGIQAGMCVSLGGIDRGVISAFGTSSTTGTGGTGTYQLQSMSGFSQGATSGTVYAVLPIQGQGQTTYNWSSVHS